MNSAHATVTAAPANGATVTFLGAASTTYTPRVMWKKDSVVAHSAPLILPYTGQGFPPLAGGRRARWRRAADAAPVVLLGWGYRRAPLPDRHLHPGRRCATAGRYRSSSDRDADRVE